MCWTAREVASRRLINSRKSAASVTANVKLPLYRSHFRDSSLLLRVFCAFICTRAMRNQQGGRSVPLQPGPPPAIHEEAELQGSASASAANAFKDHGLYQDLARIRAKTKRIADFLAFRQGLTWQGQVDHFLPALGAWHCQPDMDGLPGQRWDGPVPLRAAAK